MLANEKQRGCPKVRHTAFSKGGADKPGFMSESRTSSAIDRHSSRVMATVIVSAVDQQPMHALGAHFGEGDFLRAGLLLHAP
jgi:hypothetical protein